MLPWMECREFLLQRISSISRNTTRISQMRIWGPSTYLWGSSSFSSSSIYQFEGQARKFNQAPFIEESGDGDNDDDNDDNDIDNDDNDDNDDNVNDVNDAEDLFNFNLCPRVRAANQTRKLSRCVDVDDDVDVDPNWRRFLTTFDECPTVSLIIMTEIKEMVRLWSWVAIRVFLGMGSIYPCWEIPHICT